MHVNSLRRYLHPRFQIPDFRGPLFIDIRPKISFECLTTVVLISDLLSDLNWVVQFLSDVMENFHISSYNTKLR